MESKFKLNILWLDTKLGVAIDQVQGTEKIPLTNYFFWPKSNIWEQIKNDLDSKPWVLADEKDEILNSVAVIMNQWQKVVKTNVFSTTN